MALQPITPATAALSGGGDDTPPMPVRITKSLLGYGVIAGPLYVAVSLAQALTRDGFDLTRHAWSLLVNGDLGWIQVTNFTLTGAMLIAFAVGLHRALAGGRGRRWVPPLVGTFGVGIALSALVFRADPAQGFPSGAPEQPELTTLGALHYPVAGLAFLSLVAACFVLASRYATEGRRSWAVSSRVAGIVFLAGFGGIAGSAGASWGVLGFVAAIVVVFGWMSAVAVDQYRRVDESANR
jgi:hypothetical membrane protein